MALGKNEKTVLIVGGGAVAVYVIYRYITGSSAAATTPATDNTASQDYASLAGQEQGDIADLSNQIGGLSSQEQSDIQTLASQESSDVTALGGTITGLSGTVDTLGGTVTGLTGLVKTLGGVVTTNQKTDQKALTTLAAGLAATSREAKKAETTAKKALNVARANHSPKPSHKPKKPPAKQTGKTLGLGRGGFGGNPKAKTSTAPAGGAFKVHPKVQGKRTAKPKGKPRGKGK